MTNETDVRQLIIDNLMVAECVRVEGVLPARYDSMTQTEANLAADVLLPELAALVEGVESDAYDRGHDDGSEEAWGRGHFAGNEAAWEEFPRPTETTLAQFERTLDDLQQSVDPFYSHTEQPADLVARLASLYDTLATEADLARMKA